MGSIYWIVYPVNAKCNPKEQIVNKKISSEEYISLLRKVHRDLLGGDDIRGEK